MHAGFLVLKLWEGGKESCLRISRCKSTGRVEDGYKNEIGRLGL